MVRLTNLNPLPDPNELSADERKLLDVFKGCEPDQGVYLEDMYKAFENVVDLENAQTALARKGFIKLFNFPRPVGARDKVKQASLEIDGWRKLQELYPSGK